MQNRITLSDYNVDWAYKGKFQHPKRGQGYLTREDAVAIFGEMGVDGVEYTHCYWDDCPAAYAKKVADDAGLPIVCYVFGVDLAQPPASIQSAIDEAKRLLDRTAELGASLCMLMPGFMKPSIAVGEQRKWMVDALSKCAEHGLQVGVTVCLENLDDPVGRPLTGHGWQLREICDAVKSPGLKLIYDCAAPQFVEEDPLDVLRVMAPSIAHVHVKNNRLVAPGENIERFRDSDAGRRYTGTLLDQGAVRVDLVVDELQRSGYSGYYLIEYQGMDDPRTTSRHNINYLRGLLERQVT